ncbi:hypothetical protein [Cryptosporangium japonicum]|uniref:Uncharacterized protein n=1 Tax=Cryptosporangium japonicum TaxID=80872 RepID=A0ABN0TGX0_9ACTN
MFALNVGILIAGIATIRARVYPRALGWVITLAPILIFVPFAENASITVLLLAFGVCGAWLAVGRSAADTTLAGA